MIGLVIFSKVPGLAAAKTRLASSSILNKQEVELLALSLLSDNLTNTLATNNCTPVFCCEPKISPLELENIFQKNSISYSKELSKFRYLPQSQDSFSNRLKNCCIECFKLGLDGVVITGSDATYLPQGCLDQAIEQVSSGSFSLGPSLGCGMYQIGIPKKAFEKNPDIFEIFERLEGGEIEDFTQSVVDSGFTVNLGPMHFDVDIEEDLIQLVALNNAISKSSKPLKYHESKACKEVLAKLCLHITRDPEDTRTLKLSKN